MISTEQIESLLRWGKEKEVPTKLGPRLLRKGRPTDDFWLAWNSDKSDLITAGISVQQDRDNATKWWVIWWRELPQEVLAKRFENHEASRATDAEIDIPAPEGCAYMPFQRAAIAYGHDKDGTLLADEMGLGKSIEACGLVNSWPTCHRVLVITKARLKENWKRELEKWLVRPQTVGIANPDFFPRTDVVVINFELLRKFPHRLAYMWDAVIVDEAHKIKNTKTQAARILIGHRPSREEKKAGVLPTSGIPARRRIAITGTPLENRTSELWPILNLLNPVKFKSRGEFEARYCGLHRTDFGMSNKGATHLDELQTMLRQTLMVRRLKCEVLRELPEKTRVIVELDSSRCKEALSVENGVWLKHALKLEDVATELELAKASGTAYEYKEACDRLRGGSQIAFREIAKVRHDTAVAKIPQLIEALEDDLAELQEGKLLFFAHHTDVLQAIFNHFRSVSVMITGETPLDVSDRNVMAFQNDPRVRMMEASIRAVGDGLNLTAANLIVFGEEDWCPGKMEQCEARAHRIGLKWPLLVKHYPLNGSLDAKMVHTNIEKQAIIDKALDTQRAELITEPVLIPKAQAIATRSELEQDSISITRAMAGQILSDLKALNATRATMTTLDRRVLESLAAVQTLTPMQAALGQRLLRKNKL